MNLFTYLNNWKPTISSYLETFLQEKSTTVPKDYTHLYNTLRNFSIRGKFLRGCFVLLSYEMAGGKNPNEMIPAAAAVEINQSAMLMHDDIIDHDLLRRGEPSVYAQYIEEGKKLQAHDPNHFGVGVGISLGDLCIFLGHELLDKVQLTQEKSRAMRVQFAQDMQCTGIGQVMDFTFSSTPHEPSEEEILEMYRLKTARYSLVNPFLMGAQAAGAGQEYLTALSTLCEELGVIFQIKDDGIGLLGDEKITGKTAHSDVKENKKTLIRKYLFELADAKNKEFLSRCFGSSELGQEDFNKLKNYVQTSGAQEKINEKLQSMAGNVRGLIKRLSLSQQYKDLLFELVDYSLARDK